MRLLLRLKERGGYVLLTVLLALAVIGVLGVAALDSSTAALRLAAQITADERALDAANAGVEWAVAYYGVNGNLPATPPAPVTIPMGNYSATYSLTFGVDGQGNPTVTSVGTSGSSKRTINAGLGNGIPASARKAIFASNSASHINERLIICGDIFSNYDLAIDNNVHIRSAPDAKTKECQDFPFSGSGTAVAVGTLSLGNNPGSDIITGGWCDQNNYQNAACQYQKPIPATVPNPNLDVGGEYYLAAQQQGHLYTTATAPKTVGPGDEQIYYVNGDLTLTGGTITGRVTYATNGKITVTGNITQDASCQPVTHPCSALFISKNGIVLGNTPNHPQVWGALITQGTIDIQNQWNIIGTVSANTLTGSQNATIYQNMGIFNSPPPGLPGAPMGTGPGLINWAEGP